MKSFIGYLNLFLLLLGAIILIGFQMHLIGWILIFIGFITLLFCKRQHTKDFLLLYIAIIIVGITPVSTDITPTHIVAMSIPLGIAVFLPYLVSRFIFKDYLVKFQFHHGRGWYKTEILYILATAFVAYLLLPVILRYTGDYHNWKVVLNTKDLIIFFFGTQALGLWDELFFISTTLGILRRYLPFGFANLCQALLMTAFLYELGFRSWACVFIFAFSLLQGYVFKRTESLFYVITIHLTLDLILFLVLVHLHYPQWFAFLIT